MIKSQKPQNTLHTQYPKIIPNRYPNTQQELPPIQCVRRDQAAYQKDKK